MLIVFGHHLPAFLNDHCEHELWKASLDIGNSFVWIFTITFFLINCQSYIEYLYKSRSLHKDIYVHVIYFLYKAEDLIVDRVVIKFYFYYFIVRL